MFLADTMVGFAITAVLALVLVTGITQSRRAQNRLDDGAAALRIARRVMTGLQEGGAAPRIDEADVKVKPAPGGTAIPGRAWVEVTVNYHGRTASLVGLTPQGGAR
jgi:type II secretory pathway pseudopilin PulG